MCRFVYCGSNELKFVGVIFCRLKVLFKGLYEFILFSDLFIDIICLVIWVFELIGDGFLKI